jgi:hypothetical protein
MTRHSPKAAAPRDAISLLKADHRQVKDWFAQFESARSEQRKATLASAICRALTIHTMIEEELFYPAFLEATGERDMHHEAAIEHDSAKKLIAAIEASGPDDDYYEARVTVLSEMIQHHVNEEEKRDGLFAYAKRAGMDLAALGARLAQRKQELERGNFAGRPSSPSALQSTPITRPSAQERS